MTLEDIDRDRLAISEANIEKIGRNLREIRLLLADNEFPDVPLNFGTFELFADRLLIESDKLATSARAKISMKNRKRRKTAEKDG